MLFLPALLWREIEERTRRALPDEACGLLIGRERCGEVEVFALAAARNVASSPRTRFELDALDALAAEEEASALGLAVVGVWHSHPRGPLALSARDRAGACAGTTLIAVPERRTGVAFACWRKTLAGFAAVGVERSATLQHVRTGGPLPAN